MAEKIVYELDLDTLKFTKAADNAKESVGKIGKEGVAGFKGLQTSFSSVIKTVGLFAGAAYAASKALDLVFQGENVNKLNDQFERLSKNAGVSASAIKKGFLEAAEGEISATRAVQILNTAVSQLGVNANKIPQIMQIAKSASEITGDSAEEAFNKITNAIVTGRTMALKQMGIFIDAKKAVENYARSLGVAAGALTEADKRQAIMNAALTQGKEKFKGMTSEVDPATKGFERLKATMVDLVSTIGQVVAQAGGALSGFFEFISSRAKTVNQILRDAFNLKPETTEEAQQRIYDIQFALMKLQEQAESEKQMTGQVSQNISDQILKRTQELNQAREAMTEVMAKENAKPEAGKNFADQEDENARERAENQKKINDKFTQDLTAMRERNLEGMRQNAQSELEVEESTAALKFNIEQQYALQREQLSQNKDLTDQQRRLMEVELENQKNQQLMQLDQQLFDSKQRALDNYLNASETTAQGFARAFEVGSKKAAMELGKGVELGKRAFDSLGSNASQAFMDIGSGAKSGADALRGFMFGAIGDIAQAFGQQILLASLFPPNPVGIAAGGALLALSGFLKSQSSGSKLGDAGPSMGTGSVDGFGTNPATMDLQEKQEKKTATIVIQGNYFDTDQSRQRLTEMVRESGDFTDFKVNSIGLGG